MPYDETRYEASTTGGGSAPDGQYDLRSHHGFVVDVEEALWLGHRPSPSVYFWQWVERLINEYLCPRPDAKPLWLSQWWYNVTGWMEGFCHRQYCNRCSCPSSVD